MKYTLVASLAVMTMGYASTEATIAPTMKTVKLDNGNQYMVPEGASYTKAPVTHKAVDVYKKLGLTECAYGDITWEYEGVADKVNEMLRDGASADAVLAFNKQAAGMGHIGCASAL